ncbi:hypothetical protein CTI12_AA588930 [Artemisia annua]|uniref:Uncharacterized protein n=1 Tax=Artemisia annua TaxID=35608 RepID=A0A2U1KLJ2_ARTAN|nr:hypothetical protein CTI12_AA588930 [Artemisia annua]
MADLSPLSVDRKQLCECCLLFAFPRFLPSFARSSRVAIEVLKLLMMSWREKNCTDNADAGDVAAIIMDTLDPCFTTYVSYFDMKVARLFVLDWQSWKRDTASVTITMLEAPCSNAHLQVRIVVSSAPIINGKQIYILKSVSFIPADTPLKISDYSNILAPMSVVVTFKHPSWLLISKALLKLFFENPEDTVQSWHIDGRFFFVVRLAQFIFFNKSAFQWTNESTKYNMNQSMMTDKASMFCSYYYFLPDWLLYITEISSMPGIFIALKSTSTTKAF